MSGKKIKVCFASSSGGHYEQLLMLRPLMDEYDSFILTERIPYISKIEGIRKYYVPQVSRKEKLYFLNFLVCVLKSFYVFFKEKPDVVICTGVLAMIPICLISKLFGKRLIYIESFAKVVSGTKTGKLLYWFADQFYVQWESMLEVYPNAIYLGGIY